MILTKKSSQPVFKAYLDSNFIHLMIRGPHTLKFLIVGFSLLFFVAYLLYFVAWVKHLKGFHEKYFYFLRHSRSCALRAHSARDLASGRFWILGDFVKTNHLIPNLGVFSHFISKSRIETISEKIVGSGFFRNPDFSGFLCTMLPRVI